MWPHTDTQRWMVIESAEPWQSCKEVCERKSPRSEESPKKWSHRPPKASRIAAPSKTAYAPETSTPDAPSEVEKLRSRVAELELRSCPLQTHLGLLTVLNRLAKR